jgi:hypothetical protein
MKTVHCSEGTTANIRADRRRYRIGFICDSFRAPVLQQAFDGDSDESQYKIRNGVLAICGAVDRLP